jgi:UDP-N-acetylmuramate--alanine ligase
MAENILDGVKQIHFIGIGGSGIYPIVQILSLEDYTITGSDSNEGDTLDAVCRMGIKVYFGHHADNIKGADLIVYSAAIKEDNAERREAVKRGIPQIERAVMLGLITERFSNAICISGSHGKTTTTSMLTQIFLDNDCDPTVLIGARLPSIDGNGRAGKADLMVCEACEFVDTFLKLSPDVSVILNVDADHLDYFGTLDNVIKSFRKFAENGGKLVIANGDDENTLAAVKGLEDKTVLFGMSPHCRYTARNVTEAYGKIGKSYITFDLCDNGEKVCGIKLNTPGRHNVMNALAACAAALYYGVKPNDLQKGFDNFTGAVRRLELVGEVSGYTVADDFAHHPIEIMSTLQTVSAMNYNRVIVIFQPFAYSRTSQLLHEFGAAFPMCDKVIITEIFAAREINTYNVYNTDLQKLIPHSVCRDTFEEAVAYAKEYARDGDLVLTMGGGDIYKAARMMTL